MVGIVLDGNGRNQTFVFMAHLEEETTTFTGTPKMETTLCTSLRNSVDPTAIQFLSKERQTELLGWQPKGTYFEGTEDDQELVFEALQKHPGYWYIDTYRFPGDANVKSLYK